MKGEPKWLPWNERRERMIADVERIQKDADEMFPQAPMNDALRLFVIATLARYISETLQEVGRK